MKRNQILKHIIQKYTIIEHNTNNTNNNNAIIKILKLSDLKSTQLIGPKVTQRSSETIN